MPTSDRPTREDVAAWLATDMGREWLASPSGRRLTDRTRRRRNRRRVAEVLAAGKSPPVNRGTS